MGLQLKRLTVGLLALVILLLSGAGVAAAADPYSPANQGGDQSQTTDQGAAPTAGDSTNTGNAFQQTFQDCKDNPIMKGVGKAAGGVLGSFVPGASQFFDPSSVVTNLGCTGGSTALHPLGSLQAGVSNAATELWGDPVGKLTTAVLDGDAKSLQVVMTAWMSKSFTGLFGSDVISGVRNLTWGIQVIALAFGVAVAAIRLAIARKQAVEQGATETAAMLTRTIFAATLAPMAVIFAYQATNALSTFILEKTVSDLSGKVTAFAWIDQQTGLGPVVSLVFGLIALIGSGVQIVALILREAILSIVIALSPIAAASSATGAGKQTWKSMTSFTIGALLFKPVASLIYALAFWAADSKSMSTAIAGAVLIGAAGFAMPTIIRVVAPVAASISAGGSHAASAIGAGGAVMAGGAMLGKAMGGKGGSGSGGQGGGGNGGGGGNPASGAVSNSYGGRYSGGSGGGSASPAGASGGGAMSAARTAGSAASGIGAVVAVAAKGVQATGRAMHSTARAAEGAIGNYHGQVPR